MLRLASVLAIAATLLFTASATAAKPPSPAAVRHLKAQLRNEKAAHARWMARDARDRAMLATVTAARNTAQGQASTLQGQVTTLTSQLTAAQAENTQLKNGVPSQVAAIAAEGDSSQLQQLVLLPAHNSWACRGDIFYGTTYFSFDFNRRDSDGSCY